MSVERVDTDSGAAAASNSRYVALVPAAGSGTRLGAGMPKQYQLLAGLPLIQHAVSTLAAHPQIERVYVVLAPNDSHFVSCDWGALGVKVSALYCGGDTRAASVRNGLADLSTELSASDWVMVHDAARPCLTEADVDRLIQTLSASAVGGLLAVPMADTLKRATAEGLVLDTQSREHLWQAQTPQMFRYQRLVDALARADLATVTDEASAIEQSGFQPQLVLGSAMNLKVTYPADQTLAELILLRFN